MCILKSRALHFELMEYKIQKTIKEKPVTQSA